MNNLSWMIYLLGVSESIGITFALVGIITMIMSAVALCILMAIGYEADDTERIENQRYRRGTIKFAVFGLFCCIFSSLVPGGETAKMIIVSEVGDKVLHVQSVADPAIDYMKAWLEKGNKGTKEGKEVMKRYWASKWAKYLEQPGLKQANGFLAFGNTLKSPKCCLGHAEFMLGNTFDFLKITVHGKKHLISSRVKDSKDKNLDLDSDGRLLSQETKEKFGMKSTQGEFQTYYYYKNREFYSLAEMNDAHVPLKVIADCIRKRCKEL